MPTVLKYKFAEFEADLRAAELRRRGFRLKLQLQPFQVLVALLERPNDVVTREELRQRLWPQDTFVDFDHGLNTAVAKLRDVLGDSAINPKYIETIAKRGYRFVGDAEAISEPTVTAPPQLIANLPEAAITAPPPPAPTPDPALHPAAATPLSDTATLEPELPRASRRTSRTLFILAQIMYLAFYFSALLNLNLLYQSAETAWHSAAQAAFVIYLVTALVGIAVRLYLITATAFDYHLLPQKYRILVPALFVLDMIWALAPFLLADRIGLGLALGAAAALIYMPFAQRVLMKMIAQRAPAE
jgi:DNA-binding winged helix-turn-helix (wHTH) protein